MKACSGTRWVYKILFITEFQQELHVYLRGTSAFWNFKTQHESGPVTADLTTTTVKHRYKLLKKRR